MPRGRPKRVKLAIIPAKAAPKPARVYTAPKDVIRLMAEYQSIANGKNRGMFEDCKADIYRLWLLDYNDWRLDEIKGTGTSDRVFNEWERKFVRAFGALEQDKAA